MREKMINIIKEKKDKMDKEKMKAMIEGLINELEYFKERKKKGKKRN